MDILFIPYCRNRNLFIWAYLHVDTMDDLYYAGKPIFIRAQAIKRARQRHIAYPEQVYATLQNGSIKRFGKKGIKWIKRTKAGSIICVGEDVGHAIIVKTVERGN